MNSVIVSTEKKNCLQQMVRVYEVPRTINTHDLDRFTGHVHIEQFSKRVAGALDFFKVECSGHWQMNGSINGQTFTVCYFKVIDDGAGINESYQDDIEYIESLLAEIYIS